MRNKPRGTEERSPDIVLLEYIAGVLSLPADAPEGDRIALAADVGLSADTAARVLRKTPAAAKKALERARKRKR